MKKIVSTEARLLYNLMDYVSYIEMDDDTDKVSCKLCGYNGGINGNDIRNPNKHHRNCQWKLAMNVVRSLMSNKKNPRRKLWVRI
jgi:hypothetical protein